jgi:hypothetical protein
VTFACTSDWKAGKVGASTDTVDYITNPNGTVSQQKIGKPISRTAFNYMWNERIPHLKVGNVLC